MVHQLRGSRSDHAAAYRCQITNPHHHSKCLPDGNGIFKPFISHDAPQPESGIHTDQILPYGPIIRQVQNPIQQRQKKYGLQHFIRAQRPSSPHGGYQQRLHALILHPKQPGDRQGTDCQKYHGICHLSLVILKQIGQLIHIGKSHLFLRPGLLNRLYNHSLLLQYLIQSSTSGLDHPHPLIPPLGIFFFSDGSILVSALHFFGFLILKRHHCLFLPKQVLRLLCIESLDPLQIIGVGPLIRIPFPIRDSGRHPHRARCQNQKHQSHGAQPVQLKSFMQKQTAMGARAGQMGHPFLHLFHAGVPSRQAALLCPPTKAPGGQHGRNHCTNSRKNQFSRHHRKRMGKHIEIPVCAKPCLRIQHSCQIQIF